MLPGVGTYDILSFQWEADAIADGLREREGINALALPLYRQPQPTLTDEERDAVGMSDKPCGTCGLMVVGTNGVAMTDAKKWLTAPLPCPECSDDAGAQFRELGRQYAKKIDDAIWKALEASDERHLREAAERGRVGAGRWRTAGGSGDEIARLLLTDAERKAVDRGIDALYGVEDVSDGACRRDDAAARTLLALLERMK
jgi:hypothetical protein